MLIDIISYTDEQYAALTAEQIQEIQSAQVKKNRLLRELAKDLRKEREQLIGNGMFHADVFKPIEEALTAECDEEISWLRDALLFYLHYGVKQEGESPYKLDYSLSEGERFAVVRQYYETTYTDGAERFTAFEADENAKTYLGELYKALYDYFYEFV